MNYENIKSYEDACADQGRSAEMRPDFSKCGYTEAQERYHNSLHEFDVMQTSINKDEEGNEWKPTPDDRRWTPWFDIEEDASKPSGFGLSFLVYACADSVTCVAPRLSFRDKPRAMHMFTAAPHLFENILIPQY